MYRVHWMRLIAKFAMIRAAIPVARLSCGMPIATHNPVLHSPPLMLQRLQPVKVRPSKDIA